MDISYILKVRTLFATILMYMWVLTTVYNFLIAIVFYKANAGDQKVYLVFVSLHTFAEQLYLKSWRILLERSKCAVLYIKWVFITALYFALVSFWPARIRTEWHFYVAISLWNKFSRPNECTELISDTKSNCPINIIMFYFLFCSNFISVTTIFTNSSVLHYTLHKFL